MSAWSSVPAHKFHKAYPFFEGDRKRIAAEYELLNDDRAKLEAVALLFAEYADNIYDARAGTDFTPTEIAAQELIAATKEMGASSLEGALSSETLTSLRGLLASCDTQPKAGDVKQAPLVSGAVGEAETPND